MLVASTLQVWHSLKRKKADDAVRQRIAFRTRREKLLFFFFIQISGTFSFFLFCKQHAGLLFSLTRLADRERAKERDKNPRNFTATLRSCPWAEFLLRYPCLHVLGRGRADNAARVRNDCLRASQKLPSFAVPDAPTWPYCFRLKKSRLPSFRCMGKQASSSLGGITIFCVSCPAVLVVFVRNTVFFPWIQAHRRFVWTQKKKKRSRLDFCVYSA